MNYTERTNTIGRWVQGLLKRYEPPSKMDDDSLREELTFIVKDVNANIASHVKPEQLNSLLERVESKIRANHGARTWPTVKTFIDCTKKSATDVPVDPTEIYEIDTYKIMEKRIRNGEPISESYLKNGIMRSNLLANTNITNQDLKKYEVDVVDN